jgi:hypothetical protein
VDVTKILAELKVERAHLEEAILTLERLSRGQGKRRGRPPAWLAAEAQSPAAASLPKRRGRPPGSKNKIRTEPPAPGTAVA